MGTAKDGSLVQLRMTGNDSFYADDTWAKKITGKEVCSHCLNILEGRKNVDVYVRNRPRRTDLDFIGNFLYRVRILSNRLISIAGEESLRRTCSLGRVIDVGGFDHSRHRTVLPKRDTVIVRGEDPVTAGLCKKCGRLLMGVAGEAYVLRSQIPSEPFFLSDGEVFCTNAFYDKYLLRATLTRVEALEIPVRNEAEDGLPAELDKLKAFLRRKKQFK